MISIKLLPTPIAAAVATTVALISTQASAAWIFDPSAEIEAQYQDNVRLDQREESAIVSTASLQARLRRETEITSASVVLGGTYIDYETDEDLDSQTLAYLSFGARRSGQRFQVGVSGRVSEDVLLRTARVVNNPIFGTAPDEGSVDADLDQLNNQADIDVAVVDEQYDRRRVQVSPYFSYEVSEKTTVRLNYDFYEVSYEDDAEDVGFQGTKSYSIGAGFSHSINQKNAVGLTVTSERFRPDLSEDVDNLEATLDWNRRISDRYSLRMQVGGRRSESDIQDETGLLLRASLRRRFENGALSATLERSLYPNAFGDVLETDSFSINYNRRITERVGFDVSARAYATDDPVANETFSQAQDYFVFTPRLTWAMSQATYLAVGYRYTFTDREREQDHSTGNMVSLSFGYRPPSEI